MPKVPEVSANMNDNQTTTAEIAASSGHYKRTGTARGRLISVRYRRG